MNQEQRLGPCDILVVPLAHGRDFTPQPEGKIVCDKQGRLRAHAAVELAHNIATSQEEVYFGIFTQRAKTDRCDLCSAIANTLMSMGVTGKYILRHGTEQANTKSEVEEAVRFSTRTRMRLWLVTSKYDLKRVQAYVRQVLGDYDYRRRVNEGYVHFETVPNQYTTFLERWRGRLSSVSKLFKPVLRLMTPPPEGRF